MLDRLGMSAAMSARSTHVHGPDPSPASTCVTAVGAMSASVRFTDMSHDVAPPHWIGAVVVIVRDVGT